MFLIFDKHSLYQNTIKVSSQYSNIYVVELTEIWNTFTMQESTLKRISRKSGVWQVNGF